MEELLIRTKREKPTFIPYFISACKELPGKFILGYQPRGKPRYSQVLLLRFMLTTISVTIKNKQNYLIS